MKLIERFKGHIEFINVEYITYMYKMSPKYYVRVLGFEDAIEVSRETFEKNSKLWKRDSTGNYTTQQ